MIVKRLLALIAVLLTASLASCAENNSRNNPDITDNTTGAAAGAGSTEINDEQKSAPTAAATSTDTEITAVTYEETTTLSDEEKPSSAASHNDPVIFGDVTSATIETSAAYSAGTTEAGYPSAEVLNAYYEERNEEMRDVCDGLYYHAEDNVKFVVLKCQDELFAFSAEPVFSPWNIIYNGDLNPEIENGEFAFLTADVIFASGGIDGRVNQPKIRRVIDFEKTDLEHVLRFYSFPIWEEGGKDTMPVDVLETGGKKYFIFRCRGGRRVEMADGRVMYEQYNGWFAILDGKVTDYFDYSKFKFEDVIKLLSGEKLVTDGYDTEVMNSERIAVFRISDKYYSFGNTIFLNSFPTPIYNDKLEPGLPEGYELNDGSCALIRADLKLLNGGGLVHVPMISKMIDFEECGYDIFIDKLAISPIREYERKGDYQLDDVMFDRTVAGTWLIIVDDGKYMAYLRSYNDGSAKQGLVGSCDSINETIAFIDGYKNS